VQLDLVGRLPRPEVRALARTPGVEVHADVADTVPFLQDARVAVVPIRMGAGTRLKALEAMAAGRPVVGTRLGLEGLGVVHGRHALVADDSAAFADAVTALLLDADLAARMAANARPLVERDFGWDELGRRFVDAVLSASPTERRSG
jgi:glycosyltransferase involved in cell wall biosynthesis